MANDSKPKTFAVALSGGGLRAASFATGVIAELYSQGRIIGLSGNSGGNIAASCFMQHLCKKRSEQGSPQGVPCVETDEEKRKFVEAYEAKMQKGMNFLWTTHDTWKGCTFILDLVVLLGFVALFLALNFVTLTAPALYLSFVFDKIGVSHMIQHPEGFAFQAITLGLLLTTLIVRFARHKIDTNSGRWLIMFDFSASGFLIILLSCTFFESLTDDHAFDGLQVVSTAFYMIYRLMLFKPSHIADNVGWYLAMFYFGRVIDLHLNPEHEMLGVQFSSYEGWREAVIVSIVLLTVFPFLDHLKHRLWFRFLRWRLELRLFKQDKSTSFASLFSIVTDKTVTLGQLTKNVSEIPYYVCTTVNEWQRRRETTIEAENQESSPASNQTSSQGSSQGPIPNEAKESTYDALALHGKSWMRFGRNGRLWEHEAEYTDSEGKPAQHRRVGNLPLGEAMTLSAAMLGVSMGSYETGAVKREAHTAQAILGLGCGRWLSFKKPYMVFAHDVWVFALSAGFGSLSILALYGHDELLWIALITLGVTAFLFVVAMFFFSTHTHCGWMFHVRVLRSLALSFRLRQKTEKLWGAYVSDGGHTENCALMPLLHIRPENILLVDEGQDPEANFAQMAQSLDYARRTMGCSFFADHNGAKVEVSTYLSNPAWFADDYNTNGYLKLFVEYPVRRNDRTQGNIYVLKLTGDLLSREQSVVGCFCNCCFMGCFSKGCCTGSTAKKSDSTPQDPRVKPCCAKESDSNSQDPRVKPCCAKKSDSNSQDPRAKGCCAKGCCGGFCRCIWRPCFGQTPTNPAHSLLFTKAMFVQYNRLGHRLTNNFILHVDPPSAVRAANPPDAVEMPHITLRIDQFREPRPLTTSEIGAGVGLASAETVAMPEVNEEIPTSI